MEEIKDKLGSPIRENRWYRDKGGSIKFVKRRKKDNKLIFTGARMDGWYTLNQKVSKEFNPILDIQDYINRCREEAAWAEEKFSELEAISSA